MKAGTRVEMKIGPTAEGSYYMQPGRVTRTMANMLPLPSGYVPVMFDDSDRIILVHVERLSLIAAS